MSTLAIVHVQNPVWADAACTQIICQVITSEAGGPYLFNVMPTDPEPHGRQLWKDLNNGKYGPIEPYVSRQPVLKSAVSKPGPNVIG